MAIEKKTLMTWDKERLVDLLINYQNANDSLATKILVVGDKLEEIQKEYLVLE